MKKADLIKALSTKTGKGREEAATLLDSVIETLADAMESGESITLQGFGTFSVNQQAPRTGRNPATGEEITIPAKKVAKFKPAQGLKDRVNK
ncbi:MAG: HU family DNA-binding protein [Magnetococcales bacterium]|nr:HU family DNA-binding protein [Magnetococcales bacterium]